jgi:hypothetical protein
LAKGDRVHVPVADKWQRCGLGDLAFPVASREMPDFGTSLRGPASVLCYRIVLGKPQGRMSARSRARLVSPLAYVRVKVWSFSATCVVNG